MKEWEGSSRSDAEAGDPRGQILLGLLIAFAALTFWIVSHESPGDLRDCGLIRTTLATVTGPFAGAIARHYQSCCLDFSLRVAMICTPALAVGLLAQVIPPPESSRHRSVMMARVILWTLGWTIWFLGAPVSFVHALS